jgi:hypothetical protein
MLESSSPRLQSCPDSATFSRYQLKAILHSFQALTRSSRSLYVSRGVLVGAKATDSIMVKGCLSQSKVERVFVLRPRVLRSYTSSPQLEPIELHQHLVLADLALKSTYWRAQGGQKSFERAMAAKI